MAPTLSVLLLAALVKAVTAQSGSSSSGSPSSGGSNGGSSSVSGSPSHGEMEPSGPSNEDLSNDFLIATAAFVGSVMVFRIVLYCVQYIRQLASLSGGSQRYFAVPNPTWGSIKRNILYAPLLRKRHNTEFRLSSAINMGTLPTRFQTLFMIAIIAANITLSVYNIPWSSSSQEVLPLLRNRTGTLSTVNLIPLVIMAGRHNPLIKWMNISFDSFNMMHRLFGRLCALEALAHTLCWMISSVEKKGWSHVTMAFRESQFIYAGLIATVLFLAICLFAFSPVRHAFYETFLHLHIAMVVVSFAFLWIHLDGMSAQNYLLGAIACWACERAMRIVTLVYRNVGSGGTKALVEAMPGDAMRITFRMARPWTFKPGQHFYVIIPSIGLWTSHPFSVAWSDDEDLVSSSLSSLSDEKGLVMSRQDVNSITSSTFSAIVRRRTGFTDALWKKVEKAGAFDGTSLTLTAFVNGPYGVHRPLDSYGTVMLFAGGVGITHQVPYVRDLVMGFANETVATRKVVLVWIIQSPEHLEWIRPWMTKILNMDRRRDILTIKLFITRPRSAKEVHSPSATVQMFPGRPNVDTLIGKECEAQIGAMGVSVCGTGELQDDVRRACNDRSKWSNIDYIEESFTW